MPEKKTTVESAEKSAPKKAGSASATAKKPAQAKTASGKASSGKTASAAKTSSSKSSGAKTSSAKTASAKNSSGKTGSGKASSAKTAAPARRKGRHATKKPTLAQKLKKNPLPIILLVCIIAVCVVYGRQFSAFAEYRMMRATVERSTFYEGTYIDGFDIAGLTLEAATTRFADEIESSYENRTVELTDGTTVTAAMLGYESNFTDVLNAAFDNARTGSLEERYEQITTIGTEGVRYAVTRTMFDPVLVEDFVRSIAESTDTPPQDATILGFDPDTYGFTFSEGVPGRVLDQEALVADIQTALNNNGGSVAPVYNDIEPHVLPDDYSTEYGMISYSVTDASDSKQSRLDNISLALSKINGLCIQPGETFSFNETVGERTKERGFKKAPAYSGGATVMEYGGGICQVSSTLFNAVARAGMQIVEREEHSMEVHYVSRGRDATVDWGRKDFRFMNTSNEPIYICALLDDKEQVRVGIFGRLLPDGITYELDTETVSRTSYETQYVANPALNRGARVEKQSGKHTYVTDTYLVTYNKEGKEIGRDYLFRSKYQGRPRIYEVGP